jgi:hypothetical protein
MEAVKIFVCTVLQNIRQLRIKLEIYVLSSKIILIKLIYGFLKD